MEVGKDRGERQRCVERDPLWKGRWEVVGWFLWKSLCQSILGYGLGSVKLLAKRVE